LRNCCATMSQFYVIVSKIASSSLTDIRVFNNDGNGKMPCAKLLVKHVGIGEAKHTFGGRHLPR